MTNLTRAGLHAKCKHMHTSSIAGFVLGNSDMNFGAAVVVCAETSTGCLISGDAIAISKPQVRVHACFPETSTKCDVNGRLKQLLFELMRV